MDGTNAPKTCTGNALAVYTGVRLQNGAAQQAGRGAGAMQREFAIGPSMSTPACSPPRSGPPRLTNGLLCLRCAVGLSQGSSQRQEGGCGVTERGQLVPESPRAAVRLSCSCSLQVPATLSCSARWALRGNHWDVPKKLPPLAAPLAHLRNGPFVKRSSMSAREHAVCFLLGPP